MVRVDRAGRVVLPKPLRDRLGLGAGSRLEIDVHDGDLRLRRLDAGPVLVQKRGWWVHLGKFAAGPRAATVRA